MAGTNSVTVHRYAVSSAIEYTPVDCIATVRISHCFNQRGMALNSPVVHPNRRTGWVSRVGGTAT